MNPIAQYNSKGISANSPLLTAFSINTPKSGFKASYIKELKGVDFVIEPYVQTEDDAKIMSKIISNYKATGKITSAPKPRSGRTATKKVKK